MPGSGPIVGRAEQPALQVQQALPQRGKAPPELTGHESDGIDATVWSDPGNLHVRPTDVPTQYHSIDPFYPAEGGVTQVETHSTQAVLPAAPRRIGDCVIPVLDLRDGRVVHANGGNRNDYPILKLKGHCAGEPAAILDWLRASYPFQTVYIADLDALSGRPPQMATLAQLTQAHPDLSFHVDAPGLADAGAEHPRINRPDPSLAQRLIPGIYPILSTERLVHERTLTAQSSRPHQPAEPLAVGATQGTGPMGTDRPRTTAYWVSVDHRDQTLLGALPPPEFLASACAVIDMNLNCVGQRMTARERMARVHPALKAESVETRLLAGGIRTADDIRAVWRAGFRAVLCGSALYSGALDRTALAEPL